MDVYSLSSGSKGNCTLVMTSKHNLLIDVGGSMKKINERLMISNGIDLEDVTIIYITHEHTDHIQSFKTIYNKYPNIIFITNSSVKNVMKEKFGIEDEKRIKVVYTESKGRYLDLTPFELNHDVECYGLMIYDKIIDESYVHIADNGKLYDKKTIELLYNKDYYSIESNHDLTLQILDTKRHEGLKRRVLGFYGHTNNVDAIELAFKLVGDKTKGIVFNHLSEECNNEQLCKDTHDSLIGIWGKRTEFKNIKLSYARQNEIIKL